MKQCIYAVGNPICTAEYTCWTDMSNKEVSRPRKTISDDELIKSFQNPLYFKTESEALQHALRNAKFETKPDSRQEKIMTQCSAAFKVEIDSTSIKNIYVVNKLLESQVSGFPKSTLNLELPKNEKKGIFNLFSPSKISHCTRSNFQGDMKSLAMSGKEQNNELLKSKL